MEDDNRFVVTGTFTNMSGQDDAVKDTTGTGYYLPIQFTNGVEGMVIHRQDTGQNHIFGQTKDDSDTMMILLLHVSKEEPIINFTQYPDTTDEEAGVNGVDFTVDCSGCTFE